MYEENKKIFFSVFNVNIKGYLFNLNYVICGVKCSTIIKEESWSQSF
jgi:hypothetical protein